MEAGVKEVDAEPADARRVARGVVLASFGVAPDGRRSYMAGAPDARREARVRSRRRASSVVNTLLERGV